jgi:hypothetical protein
VLIDAGSDYYDNQPPSGTLKNITPAAFVKSDGIMQVCHQTSGISSGIRSIPAGLASATDGNGYTKHTFFFCLDRYELPGY